MEGRGWALDAWALDFSNMALKNNLTSTNTSKATSNISKSILSLLSSEKGFSDVTPEPALPGGCLHK